MVPHPPDWPLFPWHKGPGARSCQRLVLMALAMCTWAVATAGPAADVADYQRHVKPLLRNKCYACHAALRQEGGLRVDTAAALLEGGDSGPAIVPGDAARSELVRRISAVDESVRMPQEAAPLTPAEIDLISTWINAGATAPSDELPEPDPKEHWAFRPPVRPAIPTVADERWARNPVDAFLAARWEELGLSPAPPAPRHVLLRRVYLDLVGLPPTRDELTAFLADTSHDAYERVVDRLLASPHYGERWARHWMDVWRYSDWYGRRAVPDVMNSYPRIFRWRDWIVQSLNEDRGYDRMIVEMLAGDEVAPTDAGALAATGFIVRNWYKWNYNSWMKDLVEHTGKAFLGLTLQCAHCHDHKYDPISQEEYFRFRAFFEPLELRHDRVPGEPDPGPFQKYVYGASYGPITSGMIRVFDEKLDAQTFIYARGDARQRLEGRPPVTPGVPALLGSLAEIVPVDLPLEAWYPGTQAFVRDEERARRRLAIAQAEAASAAARARQAEQQAAASAAVAQAEEALAAARAHVAPGTTALAGEQSLLLHAATGRRALAHALSGLEATAEVNSFSCQVWLAADGHANVQLALDLASGATGTFVGFEQGRILAYRPGTFDVFEAGRYDLASGQNRFEVRLELDLAADAAALTVVCLPEGVRLVEREPVALNGWRPAADGKRGLFVDARPGTVAAFDELVFRRADGSEVLRFDFEPPRYPPGEVVGNDGWQATSFCQEPATSRVTCVLLDVPELVAAEEALAAARSRREALDLAVAAAEKALAAARAELTSLEARIAADDARYRQMAANAAEAIASAVQAERQAALLAAEAAALEAARALCEAQGLPPDAPQRSETVAAAHKALASAQAAVAAASTAASAPAEDYTPVSPQYPRQSTGRRTALARWIASRDNPLTARVAVNHLWNWHFGGPLVETVANFGRSGKRPSHPELLDWLAVEFMDHDWRLKHLHRLLVTSNAYRMASVGGPATAANRTLDADNKWWWRFPTQRMEAETVRDSILAAAGILDRTMFGEEIDHVQGLTVRRRSLYFSHHGEAKMQLLELFDGPDPCDCYRRSTSVMPQQALALSNNELVLQASRALAEALWQQLAAEGTLDAAAREARFVVAAFEQILTRPPTPQEAALSAEFLQRQRETYVAAGLGSGEDPAARSRTSLVHALFNHNDFITIR